jgi:F420-non-reducing hydrogenase small subunit
MNDRPKIAIYWLGACGGCDSSLIDLGESLLELAEAVEIVIWPVALDFKHDRLTALPDKSLALAIISGCVRNSAHREMAELLRAKSRMVLACGACACLGGIPGLANLRPKGEIIPWVYGEAPTVVNPERVRPEHDCVINGEMLALPEFYDHVYALNQVVAVDYYLPGCPPPLDLLLAAIQVLLKNEPPQPGSILAPAKPLCDSCNRNSSKPLRMELKTISRSHETAVGPEECFLAHGVICLGPATRDGCGGSCLSVNAPCRGCFGPVAGVRDSGARFLASVASLLAPGDDAELRALVEAIADPAGYACRFTQPVSILGERKLEDEDKQ